MAALKQEQKTIVVLGMHRSGTSAMAGMLRILGVDMGDSLLKKDIFNLKGYFEDEEFFHLNENILESLNASWDNPPEKNILRVDENLLSTIEKIARKEKPLWGWKDPRTVLTIELYLPYIKNPHFIICFRNPYEIAKSLKERDGFDIVKSLKLTGTYNSRIVAFLKEHPNPPRLFVAFEDITADPLGQAKRLAHFLNLNLTKEKAKQIEKFIMPIGEIRQERARIQREAEQRLEKELHIYKGSVPGKNTVLENVYSELEAARSELEAVHSSHGWKALKCYYNIRDKIFPSGTKRRKVAKAFFSCFLTLD